VFSWLFCAENNADLEHGGADQTVLPGLLPAPETPRMGYERLEAAQNEQPEPFLRPAQNSPALAVSGPAEAECSPPGTRVSLL
jgi:hypothetical protein